MFAQSSRQPLILLSLLAVLVLTASGTPISAQPSSSDGGAQTATSVSDETFRSSPVMFIENAGQWPDAARFQVWGGPAGTMWLAEDAIWLTFVEPAADDFARSHVATLARFDPERATVERDNVPRRAANIKLSFVGANPRPRIEPFDRLDTVVNYFIGNEPDLWRPDVPVWGGVRYADLYPGVDLELTGEGGQMVQRLAARPGADLSAVRLRVEGVDAVAVDGNVLRLSAVTGEVVLPLLQAEGSNGEAAVQPRGMQAFEVTAPFALADINPQSAIVNSQFGSPQSPADNPADLLYGTYLGGSSGDQGNAIAVDERGCAYVTGQTESSNFPTTPGAFDRNYDGGTYDAFVVKLNPAGAGLIYATFLGGSNGDTGDAIAVDESGGAYVTGATFSSDFPTTSGAFDRSFNGDRDVFVVKLKPSGDGLGYGTYLGGSALDHSSALDVDMTGSAYVVGYTGSNTFPTTLGAFDTSYNGGYDAFVAKLDPTGSGLLYATFLGASDWDYGSAIAVGGTGSAYVTGNTCSSDFPTTAGAFDRNHNGGGAHDCADVFIAKLDSAGRGLAYATFLGGRDGDWGEGLAVDEAGCAYVTGATTSPDFPSTPGAFDRSYGGGSWAFDTDAFVVKLNPAGSGLAYATFLGTSDNDWGDDLAVDEAGHAYVTGGTWSSDFPTSADAFDRSLNRGHDFEDAFVVNVDPTGGGLVYATFLGGSGEECGSYGAGGCAIAVDGAGRAYVTGRTYSNDFPTTPGTFDRSYNGDRDVFVVKLAMGQSGYTISGRVIDAGGIGIPGVTVWAGFPRNATTDAEGDYTFTGLPVGTYNLVAEKTDYAICPHSRRVTLPPGASGQNFTGLPAAVSLGFCSSSDGYKFSNKDQLWGEYPSPPALGEFSMEDMRRMFGDQAVCLPPWVPGLPCAYKLSAATWNFVVNLSMIKGHCAGMAATSLRFFKDIDQPADFQTGVTTTFGLDLLGKTRRNIAYYHAEQSALPILSYKLSQQLTSTPATTLDALRAAMSGVVSDPVVLVLKSEENQHAVTPIAVEDRGNGLWVVWVYDNEYPGALTSPVEINTTSNTWRRGAWSGDAASHSLYVIPISLFNGPQICPFCISPVGAAATLSQPATGQIWLTENANLLITDSAGRRLGYVGNRLVSEIPGAGRVDFIGGTRYPAIPVYSIPLTETYTMLLDGQPLTQTQTLRLAQFGPGYAASVENLVVSPTTRDELSIATDGSKLLYRANADKEATLTLAQDAANESHQFSLRDVELHASQSITLTNDVSTGRLAFANSRGTSNSYDLAIARATGATSVKRFYHADLTAAPGDVQSFDYRAWDGSGSLVMQIDHNGDGSVDETRVLQNQIKTIYLPLISRK